MFPAADCMIDTAAPALRRPADGDGGRGAKRAKLCIPVGVSNRDTRSPVACSRIRAASAPQLEGANSSLSGQTHLQRVYQADSCRHHDYIPSIFHLRRSETSACLEQDGAMFYRSKSGLRPTLCLPAHNAEDLSCLQGTFKTCVARDRGYIAFAPQQGHLFSTLASHDLQDDLARLPSLVPTAILHRRLIIGLDGGCDVHEHVRRHGPIALAAFAQAARDLQALHAGNRGGAYLRDIKPENMVYRAPAGAMQSGRVGFIDYLEDIVQGDQLQHMGVGDCRGTTAFRTEGLELGMYLGPPENRSAHARTADQYAFLLTVIFATSARDSPLPEVIYGIERERLSTEGPAGAMSAGTEALFQTWLDAYGVPAHHETLRRLLSDPGALARDEPDHTHLAGMLRFGHAPPGNQPGRGGSDVPSGRFART